MFDLDNIIDNVMKVFSFDEWIELDLKFSKSEIFTLLYLDRRKELTMTELVEYINSPMSTATGIADRLVRNGCISRQRSESDRRVVILTLTDKGSQLVRDLKDMLLGYINMAVEELTEEETRFLTSIIYKMLGSLQRRIGREAQESTKDQIVKTIKIE